MKKNVHVTKLMDDKYEVYNIEFEIVLEDALGITMNIGRYFVNADDSVFGEIDEYITKNYNEFVPQAQQIMLGSGLSEIVGRDIPETYYITNGKILSNKISGMFERANDYIKKNNIEFITQNGYIDFSTSKYNNDVHKQM